jgi:hypothetical protein
MARPFLMWIGAAGLGSAACIDNPNAVGSLGAGGRDNPVVVGGGGNASAGNSATGGGGAPGMGTGGTSGGDATTTITCRLNSRVLVLSKACQLAEDCVLIRGTGSIDVAELPVTTSCTIVSVGISRAEEARFATFSDRENCPPPVGCGPSDAKVQTENGVVPISAVIAVECDDGICRSYSP